jgi:cytosine/adenosine deaminase-related metal-dependent hydrolase
MTAGRVTVYRAPWLVRSAGPVIANGALVSQGGRIVRVGPWPTIEAHIRPGDRVEELSDAAILPGFVNAHTHLSLTDLAGTFRPTRDFAGWIARLAARRLTRTAGTIRSALEAGARQSLAAGTVALADVTTEPACDEVLREMPGRWRVFGEILRFGDAGMASLGDRLGELEKLAGSGGIEAGLAPHAPYTVGVDVFGAARREADRRGWPVATHLHETLDEIAFTQRGRGNLHKWLRRLRFLPPGLEPSGKRPIPTLADAGFFSGPVLVAHGNYLEDAEIEILARSASSVVYCPRSHAFFGHPEHPWRRLLAGGVNVCLGTDSLASSPSLSILDELRFLASRASDADPRTLLEMATLRGARALGFAGEVGDLAEGLRATFCVVGPLPATDDPLEAILGGAGEVVNALQ